MSQPTSKPAVAVQLPSPAESVLAREITKVLASRPPGANPLRFRILGDGSRQKTLALPASAVLLLTRILEEIARGNAVSVIPVHAELTTQEAADMLQISRPSLIQLLDQGKIDYRRVGTHRRIKFEALIKHRRQMDEARRAALAELAAYDQELGI